jgi:chemotaxis signal transduction protein
MSTDPERPIRALFWRAGGTALLLPAGAVVEVIAFVPPRPDAAAPGWTLGWIDWRGRAMPAVTLVPAASAADASQSRRLLICVGPGGGHDGGPFALDAAEQPRLVSVAAADLQPADPPAADATPGFLEAVRYRGEEALVPDLDALERALGEFHYR